MATTSPEVAASHAADDLAGNPLSGAPYAWRFTTAPRRVYLPLVLRNY